MSCIAGQDDFEILHRDWNLLQDLIMTDVDQLIGQSEQSTWEVELDTRWFEIYGQYFSQWLQRNCKHFELLSLDTVKLMKRESNQEDCNKHAMWHTRQAALKEMQVNADFVFYHAHKFFRYRLHKTPLDNRVQQHHDYLQRPIFRSLIKRYMEKEKEGTEGQISPLGDREDFRK